MREIEMSAKTVEEAVQAACEALGVEREDLNVSYEVLEFPTRKLFRTIPAKVRVTVTEPLGEEKEAVIAPLTPAAPDAPAAGISEPAEEKAAETAEPAPAEAAPAPAAERTLPLEENPRLQAAVDYLRPIFAMLGAEDVNFTAVQAGEATILRIDGRHLGALIGRRGETMESLGYLANLVVNRTEGPYVKLGLDVGGYRAKREADLTALAQRTAERVARTGYSFELEPMNPYERHVVHTAVAGIEGVRSESKGEGVARRVVIYSTAPGASNQPDRNGYRERRGGDRSRARGGRDRGERSGRGYGRGMGSGNGGRRGGFDRTGRGGRGPRGDRRISNVPQREFADRTWDPDSTPTVPNRSERIHDGDEFAFGKIDL